MIKTIRSRYGYATSHKINRESEGDKKFNAILRKESMANIRVPKNTLRIILLHKRVGYNGGDFIRDVKTVIFTYNIITFKR